MILGTKNLKTLFSYPIPKKDWSKNIRGQIIRRCLELSIPIAPGHPRRREYVLTGGYITQQFGAQKIVNSQAMQIEFSDKIRLHDEELKKKVLILLSNVILESLCKAD